MCTHDWLLLAVIVFATSVAGAETPELGQPASEEDIARVYWSVFPDGENLPVGSGRADDGRALFEKHCVACHGIEGAGSTADVLVGGRGSLETEKPLKTIGSYWPYAPTVFNYIRRAMPFTAPMSLSNDDYYAITAYLLELNGVLKPGSVVNSETLPAIQMPNRDGFVSAYPKIPRKYEYKD
jgi:cytochrome c